MEADEHLNCFEFTLDRETETTRHGIVFGGRAIQILNETGDYTMPKRGIVDSGMMTLFRRYYGGPLPVEKEGSANKSIYQYALTELKNCQNTARALMSLRLSWGVHIINIFDFYIAIKAQSDEIINAFSEFHRDFEELKLPGISQQDAEAIESILRQALRNALDQIPLSPKA